MSISLRRQLLLGGCLLAGLAAVPVWTLVERSAPAEAAAPKSPDLFPGRPRCPSAERTAALAERMARHGHASSERYPYDPGDGVRAVHRLRQAQDCYRLAGQAARARRVQALASLLVARINADYATARLILDHALESRRWSVAAEEVRRLLALTAHLAPNAYVEWLRDLSGKVATLADDSL